MKHIFKNLLLLALPASGKSEVRKFLLKMDPDKRREEFHIGNPAEVDDFPYVHFMRRIDEELVKAGRERVFYHSPDRPFLDPRTWGVLIQLINEDYADMMEKRVYHPDSAARHLIGRINDARVRLGMQPVLDNCELRISNCGLRDNSQFAIRNPQLLEDEARDLLEKKFKGYPSSLNESTIVIEFARGGMRGAVPPLPFAYEYSIKQLSPEILKDASILYIWVTPEESYRKNIERGDPNDPGSILHHSVPHDVMVNDYGCDDINYLIEGSDKKGSIKVAAHGQTFYIPIQRFDNRVDKTSFVRKPEWTSHERETLYNELKMATTKLFETARQLKPPHIF